MSGEIYYWPAQHLTSEQLLDISGVAANTTLVLSLEFIVHLSLDRHRAFCMNLKKVARVKSLFVNSMPPYHFVIELRNQSCLR